METIEILGDTYTIKEVGKIDGGKSMGECSIEKKVIRIQKSLSRTERYETLMHEICHVVLDKVQITHLLSEDLEELIIENLINQIWKYDKELPSRWQRKKSKKK